MFVGKGFHLQIKFHSHFHIVVVFCKGIRYGYPWDCLVVLWISYDYFALYDGYLWSIYCLLYADVVYCDWKVLMKIVMGRYKGRN